MSCFLVGNSGKWFELWWAFVAWVVECEAKGLGDEGGAGGVVVGV